MTKFSSVRAADMIARRSVRPDDTIVFNDPPIYHEPTVEVEGSLDVGGEWILRHYANGAIEQVLHLERKKTAPQAVPLTVADEEEEDDDERRKEPVPTRGPGGATKASGNRPAQNARNAVDSIERKTPNKPSTGGNSNAMQPGIQPDWRARAPALAQIQGPQHAGESAMPHDEEADFQSSSESPKRKASTSGQGTGAGLKKAKVIEADSRSMETKQTTRKAPKKQPARNASRQGPQGATASDASAIAATDELPSVLKELFPEEYPTKAARPDTDTKIVQEWVDDDVCNASVELELQPWTDYSTSSVILCSFACCS